MPHPNPNSLPASLPPHELTKVLEQYRSALDSLASMADDDTVMTVLTTRDSVQQRLEGLAKQPNISLPPTAYLELSQLDERLRTHKNTIANHPHLDIWKNNLMPSDAAWWWHLEKAIDPRDRRDWLWGSLTVATLTANLALVTDIASRFLTGGPGIWSSFAAIAPGILTLFAGGGALTQSGQKTIEKVLTHVGISEHRWHEAKFSLSSVLLVGLLGFHASFPLIARLYNHRGEQEYSALNQPKLASAQKSFMRALELNPDFAKAQFNLGLTYEDVQLFDQAEEAYRKALSAGYIPAYNNLARVYLDQEEPAKALALLQQGIVQVQLDLGKYEGGSENLEAAFHKNLGWAQLSLGNYGAAKAELTRAIDLDKTRPDSYCLLAETLETEAEEMEQPIPTAAGPYWKNCLKYASAQYDARWIGIAGQRVHAEESDPSKSQPTQDPKTP